MPDGARTHSFVPRRKPNLPVNDESQTPRLRSGQALSHKTRQGWGHPVASALYALQAFFGAAVVVEEREGSVVFLGGSAMVALAFEQLTPVLVRLECRAFFHRTSREITSQQANSQCRIAARAHQQAGAIHQGLMVIHWRVLDFTQGSFHVIETVGVTKEYGELEPGTRT